MTTQIEFFMFIYLQHNSYILIDICVCKSTQHFYGSQKLQITIKWYNIYKDICFITKINQRDV